MKLSMIGAGAQEGGEFFTPPSLVELIVNFIEPDHGIIHDPACGSGGMFVQTGYFVKDHTSKPINEAITVYGTEYKTNTTKLAKMNLAIHGIEGKIIKDNSFYSNPHNLTGKCDFVMANPPFNVKKIDKNKDFVKEDPRLPFGTPNADNGNYMWIQYFHSYLNDNGRAGFVMASSATDAGGSEKLIRQQLIETGDVEAIVSVGNNFFYTRSLPCHVWFLNKNKKDKDSILMIDARNTFRKVNTTLHDFSPDQLEGLTTIIKSYRGESVDFTANEWLTSTFESGSYEDVEGLNKVATMDEIIENDYSLTPGRYVGFSIQIDEDFDYQGRMSEIHDELSKLNTESDELMQAIQGLKL
jgi:type I restriction enzyme M protein